MNDKLASQACCLLPLAFLLITAYKKINKAVAVRRWATGPLFYCLFEGVLAGFKKATQLGLALRQLSLWARQYSGF